MYYYKETEEDGDYLFLCSDCRKKHPELIADLSVVPVEETGEYCGDCEFFVPRCEMIYPQSNIRRLT